MVLLLGPLKLRQATCTPLSQARSSHASQRAQRDAGLAISLHHHAIECRLFWSFMRSTSLQLDSKRKGCVHCHSHLHSGSGDGLRNLSPGVRSDVGPEMAGGMDLAGLAGEAAKRRLELEAKQKRAREVQHVG
eukprot:586530-Amphidinium_carterae.1